jgi:hypothetical protein
MIGSKVQLLVAVTRTMRCAIAAKKINPNCTFTNPVCHALERRRLVLLGLH